MGNNLETELPGLCRSRSRHRNLIIRERKVLSSNAQCRVKLAYALTPNKCSTGNPAKFPIIHRSSRGLKLSVRQSCLEASEASSGSSIPQKIIDVVIPVRISNKIRVPTDAPSLEEALSIPLLEGN